MKNNTNTTFRVITTLAVLLFVWVFLFSPRVGVFAQTANMDTEPETAQDASEIDASHEIDQLTKEIQERRQKVQEVESRRQELEDQLNIIQTQTYSIQRQISSIDTQIQDTEFEIEKKIIEMEQRKLEIERLSLLIDEKQAEISETKERLAALIRVIDQNDRQSNLFVLFSRDSFSSYLDELRSAADLQLQVQSEVKDLRDAREELDKEKTEQEEASALLEEARSSLELNKVTLDQQRVYQASLYEQSKAQEQPFEELIDQIKREEDSANAQVRSLEDAVRSKLLEQNQGLISDKNVPLSWPVIKAGLNSASCSAKETCSALFADSSYYSYFSRNHHAVDVPMPQGSPVYAPADGYVTGLVPGYAGSGGLSVLTIQHTDDEGIVTDMKTRYLHMTSFLVSYNPDNPQFVRKGETIGYSGGKCGTVGAGTCGVHTTGPHLHFEVWLGASVVNPLSYLP